MENEPYFVYRGGSWRNPRFSARVAHRLWNAPGHNYDLLGVRLIRMVFSLRLLAEEIDVSQ